MKPASGFHTAGPKVAKAIIGMTVEEAKKTVEDAQLEFSPQLASCQFKANRIQHTVDAKGKVNWASHG